MATNNYKLILAYEGTNYHGFQIQNNALTIQELLENALQKIYKQHIRVHPAGRTDRGVHARGQVVNFKAPDYVPVNNLPAALNSILPADIIVYNASLVPDSFHARFNAKGKCYIYRLDLGAYPDLFWRRFAWHIPVKLDLEQMKEAAIYMIGRRDFASFQAAGSSTKDTVRELYELSFSSNNQILSLTFKADGFLYKMVRNITGTLVDVGRGRIQLSAIPALLEKKDRRYAGLTAPAHGLCLENVYYNPM
jgi:tRNA pseudouridine38-40 synthase